MMAHHKRRRPKHQRNGCLTCKPQKYERRKKSAKPSDRRRMQSDEISDVTPDHVHEYPYQEGGSPLYVIRMHALFDETAATTG